MNTHSETLHTPRPMYWSIRREMWENRSVYLAPLIVTAVVLFGSCFNTFSLPGRLRNAGGDPVKQRAAVASPFSMAPAPIMLVSLLVGLFYSIDALYGERRDRSILFWKSLPVSDRTTVLSKAAIPLVVLPSMSLILSLITQFLLLILGTLILAGSGMSPAPLWIHFGLFESPVVMVYGLTAHVLWFAPIYCWLLLVSAWARRAALLWAVLPLLAIAVLEHVVSGTRHFITAVGYRVTGAMAEAFVSHDPQTGVNRLSQLDPVRFLTSTGLWLGLIFAAVCLAAAVRLRRNREPI